MENSKINKRFWKYVEISDNGCWYWKGCKNSKGYGRFGVEKKVVLAHRYALLGLNEKFESRMVCHILFLIRITQMIDITMCTNNTCYLNINCYRFLAKADKNQSLAWFDPYLDDDGYWQCEYFIKYEEED